jgi:ubiquinone/menaquinone biosynthesis C-methylase UbiE
MGIIFDKKFADRYDTWYQSQAGRSLERALEEMIVALLDPRPGEKVLDIGCGSGNHLIIFNKLGLDVSGIDASFHMINRARDRLGTKCALKTGPAEDLPFDDNEFDLAVMINSLEFIEDPFQALREAGRVAKRKVFVGTMNSLSWNGLSQKINGYIREPLFGRARLYNLWELKSLVSMAFGRSPLSWRSIHLRPSLFEKLGPLVKEAWLSEYSPFGSFIGISAAMVYWIQTDNLPLKVRLTRARPPVLAPRTLEDLNRNKEVSASK